MKLTYLTSITILTISWLIPQLPLNAQSGPRLPRVVDPYAPSVIEIPPLKNPSFEPTIDITKILGQDMEEGTLSFTEQPSRQFADEILIRLNQVVSKGDNISDQSGSLPSNVNKIRQSLEMKSLNYDNLENRTSNDIPIKNIP